MAELYSRPHTPTVSGVGEGGREGKVAGMAKRLAVRARWRGESFSFGEELIKFSNYLQHLTN